MMIDINYCKVFDKVVAKEPHPNQMIKPKYYYMLNNLKTIRIVNNHV